MFLKNSLFFFIYNSIYLYSVFFLKRVKYNLFFYLIYYIKNKKIKIIEKDIESKISLNSRNHKEKILIFVPEAIFKPHINAAIDLWKNLRPDFDIAFVKCFNSLPRCMFKVHMYSNFWKKNNPINNEKLYCSNCYKNFKDLSQKNNFNYFDLREFPEEKTLILDKNFYSKNLSTFLNFKYKGIWLAKVTMYDYFIITKKNSADINNEELETLRTHVLNNIKEINFLEKIYKIFPFKRIFLIDEYSMQTSLRLWSLKNSINSYFFQYAPSSIKKDSPLEVANIKTWPERTIIFKKKWKNWRNLHLDSSIVKTIYEDLLFRTRGIGGHIFSAKYKPQDSKNILKKLNLSSKKKTIGLFTSSDDEEMAITQNINLFNKKIKGNDAFSNQIDWINETIKFVESRDDFQLIIVFHPRLYIGKNSMKISPILDQLTKMFSNKKYKNVRFILPQNKISTYNIIEHVDIATVSWSSLALEISLMGIPVITGIEKNFPITPGFNGIFKSSSKSHFFNKIIELKNFQPKYEHLLESIRWHNLITFGNSNHEQFKSKQNIILNMIKKNINLYDQNLLNLRKFSYKNKLHEIISLRKSLFILKKEFEKKEYTTKLSILLNKYYEQVIKEIKTNNV
jgi:hypothetical protein